MSFRLPPEMTPSRSVCCSPKPERHSSPTCFRLPAADLASPAAPCSLPPGLPVASLAAPASLSAPALAFAGGVGQSQEQHVYTRHVYKFVHSGGSTRRAQGRLPATHSLASGHHHAEAARAGWLLTPDMVIMSDTSAESAHLVGKAARAGQANADLQAVAAERHRLGGDVRTALHCNRIDQFSVTFSVTERLSVTQK